VSSVKFLGRAMSVPGAGIDKSFCRLWNAQSITIAG
jgi:hypothetical protein